MGATPAGHFMVFQATYGEITSVKSPVTEPVLIDDGSGYFKKILGDDNESGEGFKGEQEIVKDLASKIYIPEA